MVHLSSVIPLVPAAELVHVYGGFKLVGRNNNDDNDDDDDMPNRVISKECRKQIWDLLRKFICSKQEQQPVGVGIKTSLSK